MDVVSSTPVTLWVDFEAPQGLAIPDVGTTYFSLYDGAGIPLIVHQALTPEAEASGVSIPVDALHNVIPPDRLFERRQVIVTWVSAGRTQTARQSYRLIDPPTYGTTTEDVRTYLALNEDELRDDEVDLFTAHLTISAAIGAIRFEAALASGTLAQLRAERAIVLTAATALFPSLRYRIAQAKTDGSLKFERLKDAAAFDGLVSATQAELLDIVGELGEPTTVTELAPVLIRFTTVTTDPVTGAAPGA